MSAEVCYINIVLRPGDQSSQLSVAEHTQPVRTYHIKNSVSESKTLIFYLFIKFVSCHSMYVLQLVSFSHRNLVPLSLQQLHPSLAELFHVHCKVQPEIGHISIIRLQVHQAFVDHRIKRIQVVHSYIKILTSVHQQLAQKEACKWQLH